MVAPRLPPPAALPPRSLSPLRPNASAAPPSFAGWGWMDSTRIGPMKKKDAEHLRDYLLASAEGEDAMLLSVIAAVPDDKLSWKPDHPKTRPFHDLALHCATGALYFLNTVAGKAPDKGMPPLPADKAGLLAAVKKIQKTYRKKLKSMAKEDLVAEVEFMGQKHAAITLLSWHLWHMVHHRAQLGLYLRLMGAKVPATYGPSGDAPMPG